MEKKRILVRDNKGIFLKMFKRKFKNEFDFIESSFSYQNANNDISFDRSIFVIYEKAELIAFFKLEKKGSENLVCLFNKELYQSISFLEELHDVVFIDGMKTRTEIFKDLKLHFKNQTVFLPTFSEMKFQNASDMQTHFNDFYKALYFLV